MHLKSANCNQPPSISSTTRADAKVAVLGAAGGIGQPLSMLLRISPHVSDLGLYDVAGVPGVAADVSHIPTAPGKVTGTLPSQPTWPPVGNEGIKTALEGADVVVIPAGVPRKPGMTRDDLFNTNASIVAQLTAACAEHCPDALLAIISNPVNSTVPIAAEILKAKGVYNPKKLCGVTTLDICRANTFVADNQGVDARTLNVPVIGGHAGTTILPLLSQTGFTFSDADRDALTHRIQFGGDEVVKAKAGAGSATLSMAYAGYLFTENVLRAFNGEDVTMCSFVESSVTSLPFFSSPCKFGPNGVEEVLGFGEVSAYEQELFDDMLPALGSQIEKGVEFAKKF